MSLAKEKAENLSVKKNTASNLASANMELFNATQDLFTNALGLVFGSFKAGLHAASTLNKDLSDEFVKHSEIASQQIPAILRKNSEFIDELITHTNNTIDKLRSGASDLRTYARPEIDYSKLAKMVAEEMKKKEEL